MKRPIYKLVINEDTEGMDFIGLVDTPAHGKSWVTMSHAPKTVEQRHNFNDEKQIVTGVAIATDLLIFRRDSSGFEYDVYFTKEESLKMMKMFAKKGYHNNVNLMHNMSQKVKDAYLIESYFIKADRSNIPEEFKGQNLQPGSLIFSYWVEGAETWQFVKENGTGFSLEGWFNEVAVKFLKTNKPKMKKSLMQRLGFVGDIAKAVFDTANKDKYIEAVTVDGDTITFEEPIVEGETPLFVVSSEEGVDPVLASAGEYSYEVDGVMIVLTVDENGLIISAVEAEAMENDDNDETAEAMAALKNDYETKLSAQKDAFEAQIKLTADTVDAQAQQIKDLHEAIEKLAEGKNSKNVPTSTQSGYKALKGK